MSSASRNVDADQNVISPRETSAAEPKAPSPLPRFPRLRRVPGRVYRTSARQVRRFQLLLKVAHHYAGRNGGWLRASVAGMSRGLRVLWHDGPRGILNRLSVYAHYLTPRNEPTPLPLQTQLSEAQAKLYLRYLESKPLVSIVVPVYKVDPHWLNLGIQSVVNQFYENWELILVDDCSKQPALTQLMEEWAARDSRIKHLSLKKNLNISGATNAGIDAAQGEFIGFLDHDDELTPDALTWMVSHHNLHPEAKWFYSDEAIVATDGRCLNLHLKPDYSPAFLLSVMYTCHFSVYSAEVVRRAGCMRVGFEGSQDHDLALRISEVVESDQVVHVPRVLYHWRAVPTSTAARSDTKPYAAISGKKAVEEALARRGINGRVDSSPFCPTMYQIQLRPKSCPPVTIIIPTKNGLSDVRTCVDSLYRKTRYPNFEVVVIDNQSDDPALLHYLEQQAQAGRLRPVRYDQPFNHSAMNNLVVRECQSEFAVLMNNDIELLSDQWLETLVATAQLDDSVAGVGAKLLYPDGTIQHAGILMGICGRAGHAHRFLPDNQGGYLGRAGLLNEFSGATAALLLVRRSAFLSVGGFDEEVFPTSYNDVDLWLKLQQAGYRCLYNPLVKAYHYESKSRKTPPKTEAAYEENLRRKWALALRNDRFMNPNLALDNEQFQGHRPFPIQITYSKSKQPQVARFDPNKPSLQAPNVSRPPLAVADEQNAPKEYRPGKAA